MRANLTYAVRGGRALQGDLLTPPSSSSLPKPGIVVIVHGGGWADCDSRRDIVLPFANYLTERTAAATFNVEYRLIQEGGGYPANLMDVKCAIQWISAHASDYDLDGSRIAIAGGSAGAHLALMAALTGDRADLDPHCGPSPPPLRLTLAYSAPTDLPTFTASTSVAAAVPPIYTNGLCKAPIPAQCDAQRTCDPCVDASPLAHVCTAQGAFILLQAPDAYDQLVALFQAQVLKDRLAAAGATVQLLVPSIAELNANGCLPNDAQHQAHGNSPCLVYPTEGIVLPAVRAAAGR